MHVLQLCVGLLEEGILKVTFNFLLHLKLLFHIARLVEERLTHLDNFKAETGLPLTEERLQLLLFVEGRSEKFLTPEGRMVCLGCIPDVSRVLVLDGELIVPGKIECPDVLLVKSMINQRHVGIRRVGVH